MTRILHDVVDLETSAVRSFFEQRGKNINSAHPITSVIYQDQNPDLAFRRDMHEKKHVLPLLATTQQSRVLDIGCGIGRWADALVGRIERYHGVDFSESLIAAARDRHTSSHFSFQVAAAQDITLDSLPTTEGFTHILIAGVLIYLNEKDLEQMVKNLPHYCTANSLIYIREPVAKETRLTLKSFYSSELQSTYNAIYRTEYELLATIEKHLSPKGFNIQRNEDLYPEDMNNRNETSQKIFLIRRS